MRIVGKRRMPEPGLRYPTPELIRWSHDIPDGVTYRHPKGVVRFRNHEEADAHMQELIVDAVVRKAVRSAKTTG